MFTTPHFIWLGIVTLIIAGLLILQKKYDWSFDFGKNNFRLFKIS